MAVEFTYLNPSDVSGAITLSNNNLTASMPSGSIIRGNYAHTKGKYYFEVKLDSGATTLQFGIATKSISIPAPTSVYVRCINGSNGNRYPENTSYGTGWVVGDVIGVAMDLDSGKLEFYKNGINLGISHTDLNSLINQYGEIVPYFRSGSTTPVITVNFGATAFKHTMPSGYNPYNYAYSNKFLISSENKYYSVTLEITGVSTAIPQMTSNTLPNGRAFASSINSSGFDAWKAFDRADNSYYLSATGTGGVGHLGYEFDNPIRIGKYSLRSTSTLNETTIMPKNWTFEGSNDGVSWNVLDTRTNQTWTTVLTDKDYLIDIDKTDRYKLYRINWTANGGNVNYTLINELKMFEFTPSRLVRIPNLLNQTFSTHGMNKGTSIDLTTSKMFEKRHVVHDNSQIGSGKVFKQKIDIVKIPIKKASIM